MPQTPVFSLPFEAEGDQPGKTLTGGEFGLDAILAEDVEAALLTLQSTLAANAADIATLQAEVSDLEDGTSLIGWVPVASGVQGVGTGPFTIDITDGGRFPAGTFDMLRLYLHGDLDGTGSVRLRTNATINGHRTSAYTISATGTVGDTTFQDAASQWFLAFWNTSNNNHVECTIIDTGGTVAASYMSKGSQTSAINSNNLNSHCWGELTENRLIDSLEIRPFSDASNLFGNVGVKWWVEGYRS